MNSPVCTCDFYVFLSRATQFGNFRKTRKEVHLGFRCLLSQTRKLCDSDTQLRPAACTLLLLHIKSQLIQDLRLFHCFRPHQWPRRISPVNFTHSKTSKFTWEQVTLQKVTDRLHGASMRRLHGGDMTERGDTATTSCWVKICIL